MSNCMPRAGVIINADDWGRSEIETDSTLSCLQDGRVTSVSAMVFMGDSVRAAELARKENLDVGLHLNLVETFDAAGVPAKTLLLHHKIRRFLKFSKYALLLYNPFLRDAFRELYQAQFDEFLRLYGRSPSHFDGHLHNHLCMNMLFDKVIPRGEQVRRSFYFAKGEKGALNLAYRHWVNCRLAKDYSLTDYFFSLHYNIKTGSTNRVADLAKRALVELMVHPRNSWEFEYLKSGQFAEEFRSVQLLDFRRLAARGRAE